MATDDAPNAVIVCPKTRLMQFLYVGKEYPDYQPGNWFVHKYFLAKNVPSIEELAMNLENQLLPVTLIKEAFQTGLVPHPETLVFALAVCARQRKSESLRHAAYAAVKIVCASTQHFILFIKFACQLSKQSELDPEGTAKSGWGHGLRCAINDWYISKEPQELAKCVTRYKSRYGWKHKDIIKMSHPAANKKETEAVFKYVIHGIEKSTKAFENCSEVSEILKYIRNIEDFKHCEDEVEAARLLELHNLTLDHVPAHLLKSAEVWNSLISLMDLPTLLNNLQRIHNLNLLKANASAVDKVIDQITDVNEIGKHKIHPTLVLITAKNYQHCGKPLSYEKRKVRDQAKKPHAAPPKPNPNITVALYKMLNLSFAHLKPTGFKYMVTINVTQTMFENNAWHNGNLNGAEAGCLIALALLRSEKEVTVATYVKNGIHVMDLDRTMSFVDFLVKFQQIRGGTPKLSEAISWASQNKHSYDVFINIVDQIQEKLDKSIEAIATYRTEMNRPQTKLINCAICSSCVRRNEIHDNQILTICGFDDTVPAVIEAFVKSCF